MGFVEAFVRESNTLKDLPGGWIDDDEFAGFAGGDEKAAVGRKGEALRTKAGKFELNAERGDGLVYG